MAIELTNSKFLKPDVIIISGDGRSSSSWPMGDPDEFDVASQPPFTALKYPPHFDEFYPANDDGLANQSDSEDIDETSRLLYVARCVFVFSADA